MRELMHKVLRTRTYREQRVRDWQDRVTEDFTSYSETMIADAMRRVELYSVKGI